MKGHGNIPCMTGEHMACIMAKPPSGHTACMASAAHGLLVRAERMQGLETVSELEKGEPG